MKEKLQINIAFENGKVVEMDCYEGITRVEWLVDCEEPISIEKAIRHIADELRTYK